MEKKKTTIKKSTKEIQLSDNAESALNSVFGGMINVKIAQEYGFDGHQLSLLTDFVTDLYYKKIEVSKIDEKVSLIFGFDKKKAKKFSVDVLGKRLLILDTKWFEGEPSVKLKQLGGNPEDFNDFVQLYIDEIIKEKAAEIQDEKNDKLDDSDIEASEKEFIEGRREEIPEVMKNPEEEKKSAKQGFSQYLVPVLKANDFALKVDLNIRLITLMLADDSKKFQKELLDVVYKNDEKLTTKQILVKTEKVDPTVGNWIKDYIYFVGVDAVVSSIKKAQYFTGSANVKALDDEEKKLVDKLLDFYIDLKNFYENSSKYDLDEVTIFSLSSEEQAEFVKMLEGLAQKKGGAKKEAAVKKESKSIEGLLQEKVEDEKKINVEKERIIKDTRKEFDKVAEIFEEVLLRRKRYPIIACLEILAETGALDNLLAKDARFTSLLMGYFKRNNLQSEEASFKTDPYQAKYIQHFLKYVFLERIGLSESDGARFAVKVSNIFRSAGANQYAQLAYLDLGDNKFKWTENL